MPGGDGTGPRGMGSMTGRRAGYCAGYAMPGYANPVFGGGRGFGRGFGRGRGWGRGWNQNQGGGFSNPEFTPQQEAEMLKNQSKAMQSEIDAINQRINALGSMKKEGE
jgi:hypothetical protein